MTAERRRVSRARILTGASEVLDRGGYSELTVDALARHLHMSKSTLYKHFASKEDVIVAIVDDACAATEAELAGVSAGDPKRSVEGVVEACAFMTERLPRAVFVSRHRLPDACVRRLDVTRGRVATAFSDALVKGAKSGAFKLPASDIAVKVVVAAAEAAMEAAEGASAARGAAVRSVREIILDGIAA